MEFLIKAAEAVGAIGLLIGLAWVIKPFWIIKKRWQGLLVIIGSFILFGVATSRCCQFNANPSPHRPWWPGRRLR